MVQQRPSTPLSLSRGCFYPLRDRASYFSSLQGAIRKRTSPPVYNVFDIQVRVSVNIFVRYGKTASSKYEN
ncbi:MAG: hypothetical protein ACRCT1_18585 [Microcoleaceae cyanobacterium]